MARPEPIDPATLPRIRGNESDPELMAQAKRTAADLGMPPAGAAWIAMHRLLITPRTPR